MRWEGEGGGKRRGTQTPQDPLHGLQVVFQNDVIGESYSFF
jgi:hypothetical protein